MRVRLSVVGILIVVLAGACSDDSSSKPKAAAPSTTAAPRAGGAPPTVVSLPAGIAKSERFCSLTSALADKFRAAKKPESPTELVPFMRDLATFFQEAATVAPRELVPDMQKLDQFYGLLADQVASGGKPTIDLVDAPAASSRFRQYSKTVCGVDDQVFTL